MAARIRTSLRNTIVLVLAISLLSGVAAAAVTVATLNTNPIAPGAGTLNEASDLAIDSTDLVYEGTDVTSMDVTVSNAGGSSVTVDIHVAFLDSTDAVVESQTLSGKSIGSGSSKTFTASLSSTPGVDEFSNIEVTVEQTG